MYHHIPRTALPIYFLRHFCCRMYPLARKPTEKRIDDNLASGVDAIGKRYKQSHQRNFSVTLKPVHTVAKSATICRRKQRLSQKRNFAVVSPFSATVALFCDSVDRALDVPVTASNRWFGSAAIPHVVRSTIGLLSDSCTLLFLIALGARQPQDNQR